MPGIKIQKVGLEAILGLRSFFLQENNFQIRYNACHERGWSDSYLVTYDEAIIGYGAVKGNEQLSDRNAIFEFYIIPSHINLSFLVFRDFLEISQVSYIQCQSNDRLLTGMIYQFGKDINADVVLFEAGFTTNISVGKAVFRLRNEQDAVFEEHEDGKGTYVLALNGTIVASGGFLLHYNPPFADLYMEVNTSYRKMGFGSLIIQELKKQCYLSGRVPAARCNMDNVASRATLLKAGMEIAGFMLEGKIIRPGQP